MTLGVGEIRTRAEAFEVRRRELWLGVGAGQTARPRFEDLYEEHPFLAESETFSAVERALAGADGDEEDRLRCLLQWVAERRVDRSVAPLHDEYLAWEASSTVMLDGRELPFRHLAREIVGCGDRDRRSELAALRARVLDEASTLWLDLVERERDAVRDLGYGGYREARGRLSRQDHGAVLEQGRALMEETDGLYRSGLADALDRIGVGAGEARESDARALRNLPDFSEALELEELRSLLARDLQALGLSPDAGGRFRIDAESRPLKRPVSFCSAPEVPGRVVGVLGGRGTGYDARDLLAVTGEGLGRAYVDPGLPFEWRFLGDRAAGEAQAELYRGLLSDAEWVGRLGSLPGERVEEFVRRSRWLELLAFRRDMALLDFQIQVWDASEPARAVAGYPELLFDATGFRAPEQGFVDGLETGMRAAHRIRGRMMGAMIRECLRERFGTDWYRRPSAAPFLRDLLARGWRGGASLARCLGEEHVERNALRRWFREAS